MSPDTAFDIADHRVGPGQPCLIVGEVGLAHDGSLGLAHAFIDAIADAGADAVKFQTHIAQAESTADERFRVHFSSQDRTRYDYWERTSFDFEGWVELSRHAGERGLILLSSPFSEEAVDLLERVGIPAWKVGSGEVGNSSLLERISKTGLPVLLSSGMSPLAELDRAVESVRRHAPVAVLQCTSAYPSPAERIGLNMLELFRNRYGCSVGLSDHSGTIYPSIAAVTLGANVVEVHVVMSRRMFGPDVSSSVTVEDLAQLIEGARMIEAALSHPVNKDAVARELEPLRELFTKSIVARSNLRRGAVLARSDLALKKPGTGLGPDRLDDMLGRRLIRDIAADVQLREEDVE